MRLYKHPKTHIFLKFSLFLLAFIIIGCNSGTSASTNTIPAQTYPALTLTSRDTITPTFTLVPTLTASPIPSITPTPTRDPWFFPTPTPIVFQTDWTLAYTIVIVDDPKDPDNHYHTEIRSIQINEKQPMKLLENPVWSLGSRWSPDGKRLAFISIDKHPASLYILTLETGLLVEFQNIWKFAWSPDGQKIVYCENSSITLPPPYHCYLSESDQPAQSRRVLTSGDWYAVQLEWSPKGDQILALVDREIGPRMMYLIHLDGQVENIPTEGSILGHASWHPDGEKIAYDVDQPNFDIRCEAREINLTTMEEIELTHSGKIVSSPLWSPDGKYLAFVGIPLNQKFLYPANVYILNQETGKTILASKDGADGYFPSWSPDGKYLAYLQSIADYGENPLHTLSLHVFDLSKGIAVSILQMGAYRDSIAWKPMP